jgi:hypothetical protein
VCVVAKKINLCGLYKEEENKVRDKTWEKK